jgi:Caudovirus prohead serine protease
MLPCPDQMLHRLAADDGISAGPVSYDKHRHIVEAVISVGSPVKRAYGTEVLLISSNAVDLSRIGEVGIPLLDHHNQCGIDAMLGRLADAWIERGALLGRFKFNQTPEGKKAEGMVARGEITGISAGYRVEQWLITDADGDIVDEKSTRWHDDLTFTATRWQLFECSLVAVPADAAAAVRSLGGIAELKNIRARMLARQHIVIGHPAERRRRLGVAAGCGHRAVV